MLEPSAELTPAPSDATDARILIVDDDTFVCKALLRALSHGRTVEVAQCGAEAIRLLGAGRHDVIIADIHMPDMSGVELLREVRRRDPDVPVILITGEPEMETAIRAVEYGAFRYLAKPLMTAEIVELVTYATQVNRLAALKRQALAAVVRDARMAIDIDLEARFERALDQLWMAFQPIVSWQEGVVVAYEALVRCESSYFPNPAVLLETAERLSRIHELGRVIRRLVAEAIPHLPGNQRVFVNLHPSDLNDEMLGSPLEPLTRHAERVVLEITERAALIGVANLDGRLELLRQCGYEIAVDDLGAGYAGLDSFVRLRPEVVKLDMSLVRGIDRDAKRRAVVGPILSMCQSLQVRCIVEGVETPAEAQTLAGLGADLMQGYAFARPGRAFVDVNNDEWTQLRRQPA